VQSVHGHTTNIQFIQTAVNHHKKTGNQLK